MRYENRELHVSFELPDRPTVRQQLRWRGETVSMPGAELFEKLWAGARQLITAWECDAVGIDADLDALTDPAAAQIVEWVGLQVFTHMRALEDLPKN